MTPRQVFAIICLLATIALFVTVIVMFMGGQTAPSKGSKIVPDSQIGSKVDCTTRKTLCDPNDVQACANACSGAVEMQCVKLNDDHVCLPKQPDIECNPKHGGIYVWTGYGFTDKQEWSCLCANPQVFGGPNCNTINPAYCGGGSVTTTTVGDPVCTTDNGYLIYNDMCVKCNCPAGTQMVMRATDNTPVCVSNTATGGGGYMGLLGNYVKAPDWRNVYYNVDSKSNLKWSQMIAKEFGIPDSSATILTVLNKYPASTQLTQAIVNDLIAIQPKKFQSNTPFDPNYKENRVSYSYFDNVYYT